MRSGLNADMDFSRISQWENRRQGGEVAALFANTGHIMLASFVLPYREGREFVPRIIQENLFARLWRQIWLIASIVMPRVCIKTYCQVRLRVLPASVTHTKNPQGADSIIDPPEKDVLSSRDKPVYFVRQTFSSSAKLFNNGTNVSA